MDIVPTNKQSLQYSEIKCKLPYYVNDKTRFNCVGAGFLMSAIYQSHFAISPPVKPFDIGNIDYDFQKIIEGLSPTPRNEIENAAIRYQLYFSTVAKFEFSARHYNVKSLSDVRRVLSHNIPVVLEVDFEEMYGLEARFSFHAVTCIGIDMSQSLAYCYDPAFNSPQPKIVHLDDLTKGWGDEKSVLYLLIKGRYRTQTNFRDPLRGFRQESLQEYINNEQS